MWGGGKHASSTGISGLPDETENEKDANYLKKLIDNYEVISFDLFDTLLLRPFVNPDDVFRYIGKMNYNLKFPMQRELAQKRARLVKITRNKGIEDITLDDIYSKIEGDYKQYELDFEYKILTQNRYMHEIFEYAKQKGKKIIITSDMYLDSEFLTKVLHKNDYQGFYKIYLSSEIGKSKVSGNLFKYILSDMKISSSQILHIGDNESADIKGAEKAKITSYKYKKVSEQFFEKPENRYYLDYYKNTNNKVQTSMILGMRILKEQNSPNKNFWYKIGYNYGGVIALFYILCVIKISKIRNLTDLLFIARDGYVLNEVYKKIKTDNFPENHYIYASRKLHEKYYNETESEYKNYINSIKLKGKNAGIIDTCAGNFSAQALLTKYLPDMNFIGIYMASVLNYKYNYINLSNKPHTSSKLLGFVWEFIEFILTSFEPPIEDMKDRKPVYRKDLTEFDLNKNLYFNEIVKGELDFADDYLRYFDINLPDISFEEVFKYIEQFWQNMTDEERNTLNNAKSPININQNNYVSLVNEQDRRKKKAKEILSFLLYNK